MELGIYSFVEATPQHRLPDAVRLGAAVLMVSDLARSVLFYERVLGMRDRCPGSGCRVGR